MLENDFRKDKSISAKFYFILNFGIFEYSRSN